MDEQLITQARSLARELHAEQTRKATTTNYFDGHLEPVAELVRAAGGSDVQIAAAYLHDAAEDCGGQPTLDRIEGEIGPAVAAIVEHLSDSLTDTTDGRQKESWALRKRRYVAGLAEAPMEALEVSVADKLHNASSILADHQALGAEVWQRFNEKNPASQLWYYGSLAGVFREHIPDHPLTGELTACIDELTERVRAAVPGIDDLVQAIAEDMAESPRPSGRRLVALGRPASFEPEDLDRFAEEMAAAVRASVERAESDDGDPNQAHAGPEATPADGEA